MKKTTFFILILIFANSNIFSQIEYGGEPISYSNKDMGNNIIEFVLPFYEFEIEQKDTIGPVKIGELRKLNIDVLSEIKPIVKADYYIYRFSVKSLGAKSISVYFDQFDLSKNTKVFFYNSNDTLGAYIDRNVVLKTKKVFVSPMLNGDYATVEINILKDEINKNNLSISKVVHRPITTEFMSKLLQKEQESLDHHDCLVDVNCSEGDDWCNQIRSVAVFSFFEQTNVGVYCTGGEFACSGALINNTNNDFKQYFLTARHCTFCDIDHNTTTFRFNFQRPECEIGFGNINYVTSVQGSTSIEHAFCDIGHSDISLLEILNPIPLQYNVYFSGWDVNSQPLYTGVHSISHPSDGDWLKKITGGQIQLLAGPKWDVYWDFGTIFGGSSGGPVFKNANKNIVGVISGSITENCQGVNQAWVGKLKACWNESNNLVSHLANGSSTTVHDGIDPILACQENIELYGQFRDAREYNASKHQIHLQSGNSVNISSANRSDFNFNSNFKITAGERITIFPNNSGTHIEQGAIFKAYIAPCATSGYCGEESSAKNLKKEDIKTTNIGNNVNLNLYPNPYSDNFSIEFDLEKQENVTIQISNTIGEIVYEESFKGQKGNQKHLINLEALDKILIAKICIGNECYKAKMVKQ